MNYGPGGLISVHVDDRTLGYQEGDFDQDQAHIDWRLGTIRQRPALVEEILSKQKPNMNLSKDFRDLQSPCKVYYGESKYEDSPCLCL